jgi:hypothetical protein
MWGKPTEKQLAKIPKLYETEKIDPKNKIIHMHFFLMGCDWYVCEYSPEEKLFFGFAILNGDYAMAEWGYISFDELEKLRIKCFEVERDKFWKPISAMNVDKICEAQNWGETLCL